MGPAGDLTHSVLEHLLEGFQVIGRDWTYLYVNPAAARHGRQTVEALVGRKMWEAYPGIENTPLFEVLRRVLESHQPAAMENHFAFPDGSEHWFELRIEPVPQGICVHSIDIDRRKLAESELVKLNAALEQRVATRTLELAAVNRDLEAFSYSVSHDLRAPLRAIDGFTALVVETDADRLTPGGLEHLKRVRSAVGRMEQLIEDLLAFSRVGHASVARETVDFASLARAAARELEQSEPRRKVEWTIPDRLALQCDPGLGRVVLENLLANAWKFTGRTACARIEVTPCEGLANSLQVRDNGAGFDMRYAGSLFRPFFRLHQERDFPGTGIGLALVRRVAEKHGGTVLAEGAVGRGATVTVSFGPGPNGE